MLKLLSSKSQNVSKIPSFFAQRTFSQLKSRFRQYHYRYAVPILTSSMIKNYINHRQFSSITSSPHRLNQREVDTSLKEHHNHKQRLQQPVVCGQSGNLSVELDLGQVVEIPLIWLRDHCRCPLCYNYDTLQKIVDLDLVRRDLNPASIKLDEVEETLSVECEFLSAV